MQGDQLFVSLMNVFKISAYELFQTLYLVIKVVNLLSKIILSINQDKVVNTDKAAKNR